MKKTEVKQELELNLPSWSIEYLPGAPPVIPMLWHQVNEERGLPAIENLLDEAGTPESSLRAAHYICALSGSDASEPESLAGALTIQFVLEALSAEESGIDRREVLPIWEGSIWGGLAAAETARLLALPGQGATLAAGILRHFGGMLEDWKLPRCILEPITHYRYPLRAGSYFLATAAVHIGDLASAITGNEDFLSFIDPKIIDLTGFNIDHYAMVKRILSARGSDMDTLRELLRI